MEQFESTDQVPTLHRRIDALYDMIATTRDFAKNAQFNDEKEVLQHQLSAALVADFGVTSPKGVPAWEKLVGGSETIEVSKEVADYVTNAVEALVTKLEDEWGE